VREAPVSLVPEEMRLREADLLLIPSFAGEAIVNRPLVSGIFVSLLLLLVAAGIVSGGLRPDAGMIETPHRERLPQDAHVAYYERHLEMLGIDRLNCR
jgi:hypothetical protein